MPDKIYPCFNNIVFVAIFGKEGNEELLARLIEATLELKGDRRIRKLTLLNPFNMQKWKGDKGSIVDVRATDFRFRRFTIEMQVREQPEFTKRMAYYLSLLYAGQLRKGHQYDRLYPAYGIAILNYIMFKEHDRLHSAFAFRDQVSGEVLPNLMELHFIEMAKYIVKPRATRTRLEKWLYLLRFGERLITGEPLPEDLAAEKEFAMAVEELRRVNASERLRTMIEQREKAERDHLSELATARKEGKKEGLKEGKKEGVREGEKKGLKEGEEKGLKEGKKEGIRAVAGKMLDQGMNVELISEVTGLSIEEIIRIRDQGK